MHRQIYLQTFIHLHSGRAQPSVTINSTRSHACLYTYTYTQTYIPTDMYIWMNEWMGRWMDGCMDGAQLSKPKHSTNKFISFPWSVYTYSDKKFLRNITSEIKQYIKWELQKDIKFKAVFHYNILSKSSKRQLLHSLALS